MVGVVVPLDAVDVVLPLDARVTEIAVEMGARVLKGERVARFEVDGLRERLDGARASVSAASALVRQAEIDLTEAEQQLRALEVARAAVPGAEIAAAGFTEQRARSALQEARARYAKERSVLAEIERVSAGGVLEAPIDGIVTAALVSEGASLHSGEPVLKIASGVLGIRFAIEPEALGTIAAGDPLRIALPAVGVELKGNVVRISPWIDAASGVILAEGTLEIQEQIQHLVISGAVVEVLEEPRDGT